jgi:Uma2 family endonuclease
VWAINPAARSVEVYLRDQRDPVMVLYESDTLSGEDLLPGFSLPVKSLFALSQ